MTETDRGNPTHTQRALLALRQRVLSGAWPGGTRLLEVALAAELDISRTPIRAALSQLAEEGLLDRARGGGFMVRTFALADVVDTIELRGVLEGTAARLAAERGAPPEALAAMESTLTDLDDLMRRGPQDIDLGDYSILNAAFHRALASASGSSVIQREIERVTRLPFAAPSAFLGDHRDVDRFRLSLIPAQEQHRAILEAIRLREGGRAESVAREHARAARRNAEHLFASSPGDRGKVASLALVSR